MADNGLVISQSEGVTLATIQLASITEGPEINKLGNAMFKLIDELDHKKIIVDFRSVSFLSSQMIGVVVTLHKKAKANKSKVVFCGLRPSIMKVFEITKLNKILTFADNETAAMKKFKWLGF